MGQEQQPSDEPGSGTTARVLAVLRCFGERPQWGVAELGVRLGLPKSTVHRLITLCRDEGFIDALGDGTYGIGTEFSRVALQVAAGSPLLRTGAAVIEKIAHDCQEVCILALALPEKLAMTYVAKAEPSADFRYHVDLHTQMSLCWGACGRTILAHLPSAQAERAIGGGKPSPSGTPFSARALRADLELIRAKGYCVSHGQHKLTAVGVAVPFFAAGGVVRGSIGISVPTFRFRNRMLGPLVKALEAGCGELTYVLGGTSPSGT